MAKVSQISEKEGFFWGGGVVRGAGKQWSGKSSNKDMFSGLCDIWAQRE